MKTLEIPCDSGLQKVLYVDDKYRDYIVIGAQSQDGLVRVVVSKHYAAKLRDELNKFLES